MKKAGRMLGPAEQLKSMGGVEATKDGSALAFDMITHDDVSHTFWTAPQDLAPFVRYLIDAAQFAVRVNGQLPAPPAQQTVRVDPIDTVALHVGPGRTNTEALLTLHVGAFPMTFAIDASALKNLEAAIKQLQVVKPTVQ